MLFNDMVSGCKTQGWISVGARYPRYAPENPEPRTTVNIDPDMA